MSWREDGRQSNFKLLKILQNNISSFSLPIITYVSIDDDIYGRSINHLAHGGNLMIKMTKVENNQSCFTLSGEEPVYDYGDGRKGAVKGNPQLQY